MKKVYICDAVRTPVGRYGGVLSAVRTDDLAAVPLRALLERNSGLDPQSIDDVILGCANQAGEDNRNVARMALLLAGYPETVPGATVNRLCGSGIEAVGQAARAIKAGEAEIIIAGGVESMSRAPFVVGKSGKAFARNQQMYDTTMGWRFVNKKLDAMYGTEAMIQTAENIALDFNISRKVQDVFALHSQTKALKAQQDGRLAQEIVPVTIPSKKGAPIIVDTDEHPRETSLEKLSTLNPVLPEGSITAGNASGLNDGAAAVLLASEDAVEKYGLQKRVEVKGMAAAGVLPRIMGMGPVPATYKLLQKLGVGLDSVDIIEINEAFAAQAIACIRELGLKETDERINARGGAIALGHPLGMSGTRIITTAFYQLIEKEKGMALCTMCISVRQRISMLIENI